MSIVGWLFKGDSQEESAPARGGKGRKGPQQPTLTQNPPAGPARSTSSPTASSSPTEPSPRASSPPPRPGRQTSRSGLKDLAVRVRSRSHSRSRTSPDPDALSPRAAPRVSRPSPLATGAPPMMKFRSSKSANGSSPHPVQAAAAAGGSGLVKPTSGSSPAPTRELSPSPGLRAPTSTAPAPRPATRSALINGASPGALSTQSMEYPPSSSRIPDTPSSTAGSTASAAAAPAPAQKPKPKPQPKPVHILEQKPESIVGPTLTIKGVLVFDKLLRIEGTFEGRLISTGSLVVGETGVVRGDIQGLKDVYIEGKVYGDLICETVQVRKRAVVQGNITTMSLTLDPETSTKGALNVTPRARVKVAKAVKTAKAGLPPSAAAAAAAEEGAPAPAATAKHATPSQSQPAALNGGGIPQPAARRGLSGSDQGSGRLAGPGWASRGADSGRQGSMGSGNSFDSHDTGATSDKDAPTEETGEEQSFP